MIGVIMAGGRGSRMQAGKKNKTSESTEHASSCLPPSSSSQPAPSLPPPQQPQQEKLLIQIDSIYAPANEKIPVIEHVIHSLAHADCIDKIFVAASGANSPETLKVLRRYDRNADIPLPDFTIIDTDGSGYSKNLGDAIRTISRACTGVEYVQKKDSNGACKALIVSADMPHLDASVISSVSDHYAEGMWTSIVVSEPYAKMWDATLEYTTSVNGVTCCYTGVSLVDCIKFDKHDGDIPQRHVILDDHRIAFTLNTQDDHTKLSSFLWPPPL